MTQNEVTWLIFLQIMIMSIIASAIGLAVGVLASVLLSKHGLDLSTFTSHNRYFTVSAIIRPRLTDFSLLLPPGLAEVSGLMASLWPAIMVRRQRPADLMRLL
ncbi:MAG: FtsX-like permease family protein [Oscillochloris sp.]|nr:FtsX-like permease family protein [Oscillochloris sp.]